MNKAELKSEVKRKLNNTNRHVYTKDINLIIDEVFNTIIDTLSGGEEVNINRFGKFSYVSVDGFLGYDPVTKERVQVAPHKRITFKAGTEFKRQVNGDEE